MKRALLSLLLLALGCEHKSSARGAPEAPPDPPPVVAQSAAPTARCVRPFSEQPAPEAAKAQVCPEDPSGPLELGNVEVVFVDAPGKPRVVAQHALSEEAKAKGLMYRTEMPEDAGMLFTWDDEKPRRFWMRNTCLPLDMIFIDSRGWVVSILEQVPTLNTAPRPSGCPAQHVLEVNAGWARARGVRPGQKVQIGS